MNANQKWYHKINKSFLKRKEEYLDKCKDKHGDRFDYSQVDYIDSYHKVVVVCKEHNLSLEVDPSYFISDRCDGYICPGCTDSDGVKFKPEDSCYSDIYFKDVPDDEYQLKYSEIKPIRDALLKKQNGICPICKNHIEMPTLDHYHTKRQKGDGLVRGVLCNTCNRMVGVVENNFARNGIHYSDAPDVLVSIADYLRNYREPYIYPSEKPKDPVLMKSSYNKLVKAVNGKQKIPKYNGKLTKALNKLFEKYSIEPSFKKSR